MTDVTVILNAIESGQARADELLPVVYDELRALANQAMRREQPGITLQPTALVHEAYLRLVGNAGHEAATWQNRRHFFGAAAIAMQRILVEQARQRQQLKRGGDMQRVELTDVATADAPPSDADLLALDDALRELEREDPAKAELVRLRYFAGLTEEEAAQALNISRATASRWWTFAKAWLFQKVDGVGAE